MKIEIKRFNNYQIIELYGEFDLNNSRRIKREILKIIQHKNNVIVDLTHLQYIDSSGMASLDLAFHESRQQKTKFHLAGANGSPLEVLHLTRLNSVFSFADFLEIACVDGKID